MVKYHYYCRGGGVLDKTVFKKYSIYLAPLYFVISMIVGFSMVTPMGKVSKIDSFASKPVKTVTTQNPQILNDCKFENGVFVAKGNDPYIVYDCSDYSIEAISANFVVDSTDDVVVLYFDIGTGFNEDNKVPFKPEEDTGLDFAYENKTLKQVRFDFQGKLKPKEIDFYDDCIILHESVPINALYPPIIVVISLIISAVLTIIEAKTKAVLKIVSAIKKNAKRILVFIVGILSSAIIGVVLTYVTFGTKSQNSLYAFFFLFSAVAVVFEIIFFRKTAGKKTENVFLAICLTIGMMMIIITPIGHVSWDTGTHYRYALSTTAPNTQYSVSDSLIITNAPMTLPSARPEDNIALNITLNIKDNQIGGATAFEPNIAHFGAGVAVKLARFLGFSFVLAYMAGKIPILLTYAFVCYFAIKKLNSGKMLLSVIALFPTSLLLATNYSYDYWVIAFSFLGLAFYYSEIQQPLKPISDKDTFIMFGSLFLASLPKAIYLTLLLIPLFMPPKKIIKKRRYYSAFLVSIVLLLLLFVVKAKLSVSGGGDMRGGDEINSSAQLSGIIANPLGYSKVLFNFLKGYLSVKTMPHYISNLAYLGLGTHANIFIWSIIILGIIDKNKYDAETAKLYQKIIAVLLFIGTAAMIATALYVDFTPVGSSSVGGCQPRYLIPIIFPVCYTLGSFKKHITFFEKHRAVVNTVVFAACSYSIYIDVFELVLKKMV